jgi:3-deoxy-D-manno-octulosonate 8-phosphate phosphatase (KDO 8-P phosphatase)
VSVSDKLRTIQALAFDVDGVLTDGGVIWGAAGEEMKRFTFEDIMGLARARRAGLFLGLISGEDSPLVDRLAQKVGIHSIAKGCKDKGTALRQFATRADVDVGQVAYMGDDVNDLPAFQLAGLSVAPANAQPLVKQRADLVMTRAGGSGAARELIEMILEARGLQDAAN